MAGKEMKKQMDKRINNKTEDQVKKKSGNRSELKMDRKNAGRKNADPKSTDQKSMDRKNAGRKNADPKSTDQKSMDRKNAGRKNADPKSMDQKSMERKNTGRKNVDPKSTDQKSMDRKNADRKNADPKSVDQKSMERKNTDQKNVAACPVYKKCGGCQLLHMDYHTQLGFKKKQLSKLLAPYCKVEEIIGMEHPEHYRCKVHAAFGRDKKGTIISGVYKEGTHLIVPVEVCLLEDKKADAIMKTIRDLLKSFKIKTYDEDTGYGLLRHVLIRKGYVTGQIMVVLVLASPIMPSKNNFVKALRKEHPEITTVIVNVNDKRTSMVLGEKQQVIYGPGYIEDELCGMTFKISPKSFYQVNPPQAQRLYTKAMEYAGLTGKETVLDAYCGTGTIGLIAAEKAGKVLGVEVSRDGVRDAVNNAKQNKVSNISFYQADAGEFMERAAARGEKIDVVLMDPPRMGSSERFLQALTTLKPSRVVYVSCNPQTLARDLKYLCDRGYRAEKAAAVDMFPFTDDTETVVSLSK